MSWSNLRCSDLPGDIQEIVNQIHEEGWAKVCDWPDYKLDEYYQGDCSSLGYTVYENRIGAIILNFMDFDDPTITPSCWTVFVVDLMRRRIKQPPSPTSPTTQPKYHDILPGWGPLIDKILEWAQLETLERIQARKAAAKQRKVENALRRAAKKRTTASRSSAGTGSSARRRGLGIGTTAEADYYRYRKTPSAKAPASQQSNRSRTSSTRGSTSTTVTSSAVSRPSGAIQLGNAIAPTPSATSTTSVKPKIDVRAPCTHKGASLHCIAESCGRMTCRSCQKDFTGKNCGWIMSTCGSCSAKGCPCMMCNAVYGEDLKSQEVPPKPQAEAEDLLGDDDDEEFLQALSQVG